MSDHNFEKQVQQRLEELKIPPAEAVWSAVEKRIRKDKRRRTGLIVMPILFLFLGAASYFILRTTVFDNATTANLKSPDSTLPEDKVSINDTKQTDTGSVRSNATPGLANNNDVQENKPIETVGQKTAKGIPIPSEKDHKDMLRKKYGKQDEVDPKLFVLRKNDRIQSSLPKRVITNKEPGLTTSTPVKTLPDKNIVQQKASDERKDVDVNPVNRMPVDSSKGNMATVDPEKTTAVDSIDNLVETPPVETGLPVGADSVKKLAEKTAGKSKFKWGIDISAGVSNLTEGGLLSGTGFLSGVFTDEKALVADVADRNVSNAPGNAPAPIVYQPSAIEKGFSFTIGAIVQRNIARRFKLSTGLHYKYLSNNIQVGSRVDSLAMVQNAFGASNVSQFYRSAPVPTSNKYHNQFHYVDLPVTLHIQLNRSNRIPILWNGGLSLSYLVSTNALHFDSRTGVYYNNNTLFNKLQANISTGLSVLIFSKSKLPIYIGPQVQYALTNLLKSQVPANRHFHYVGINSRFLLKK